MKEMELRIVAIGKIHTIWWRNACDHYKKLISRWQNILEVELRDSNSALPINARIEEEGIRILKQLGKSEQLVILSEKGQCQSSPIFAKTLEKLEHNSRKVNFVIGGPFGLSDQVLEKADLVFSLSPMTWPHELARVLLLEQIFRANCIRHHFPYHH